jgi:hypothetical protein
MPWTPDVLVSIEGGQRHGLDVAELLMLAEALGQRPSAFFNGEGNVRLSRVSVADRERVRSLLDGKSISGHLTLDFQPEIGLSEAELHAASRLEANPWKLREIAQARWAGRRLDDERDRRLGKSIEAMDRDARRAHRGRITRQLLEELRESMEAKE